MQCVHNKLTFAKYQRFFSTQSSLYLSGWCFTYYLKSQTVFLSSVCEGIIMAIQICLRSSWGRFSLFITILPKPFPNLQCMYLHNIVSEASLSNLINNKLGQNVTTDIFLKKNAALQFKVWALVIFLWSSTAL